MVAIHLAIAAFFMALAALDSYLPLQTSVQCPAPGCSAPGQSEGVQPAGRTGVDYD